MDTWLGLPAADGAPLLCNPLRTVVTQSKYTE